MSLLSTNHEFYTSDSREVNTQQKFWIAIFEKSISMPFFAKQTQTINEITLSKAMYQRSLFNRHHNIEQILL